MNTQSLLSLSLRLVPRRFPPSLSLSSTHRFLSSSSSRSLLSPFLQPSFGRAPIPLPRPRPGLRPFPPAKHSAGLRGLVPTRGAHSEPRPTAASGNLYGKLQSEDEEKEEGKGKSEEEGKQGKTGWPRPGHPYGWIDAEAEGLIAKAYQRHRALADTGRAFPPSLGITVSELEALAAPQHYPPQNFVDRACLASMRFLRRFVHAFFREKYDHHAVCLETVAAIPGIVGAFHRHLRSLRNMSRDHGFINPLLEESENERMHLLIWMQLTQPTRAERALVIGAQAAYLSFYSVLYLVLPRAAHRLVGYLEEEAHAAYTDYLAAIDAGRIANRPAPKIAVDYYHLEESATVRDVVLHVRADEAAHREFNHFLAGKYERGDLDSPPVFMKVEQDRQSAEGGAEGAPSQVQWAEATDVGDNVREGNFGGTSK